MLRESAEENYLYGSLSEEEVGLVAGLLTEVSENDDYFDKERGFRAYKNIIFDLRPSQMDMVPNSDLEPVAKQLGLDIMKYV